MATEIRMPQFGVSMETGTIAQWFKAVGDPVKAGEPLASIETEKLTNDVICETDGVVLALLAQVGDELPIQGLMAIVGGEGESWTAPTAAVPAAAAPPESPAAVSVTESPARGGRVKASPLARKVAAKLGVDLAAVTPAGTSGRIREKDVRAYADAMAAAAASAAPAAGRGTRTEKMSGMRRAIAKNMGASLQTNAQTCNRIKVDMTAAVALCEKHKALGQKISYNDIMVRCAARALMEQPVINASLNGNDVIYHDYVNMGLAVSVPGGLIVPVIRDADLLTLAEIHDRSGALIEQARTGTLSDRDYHGGTFTISSLGMFDIDSFTAIINPPESAILAVGKVAKVPVVTEEDEIVVRPMCTLSLSYDHRLIDGAEAARFLQLLKRYLQDPLLLL